MGEACIPPERVGASCRYGGPMEAGCPAEDGGGDDGVTLVEVRMHLHLEKSPEAFEIEVPQSGR